MDVNVIQKYRAKVFLFRCIARKRVSLEFYQDFWNKIAYIGILYYFGSRIVFYIIKIFIGEEL